MELDHYKFKKCVSTIKTLAESYGISNTSDRLAIINERIHGLRQKQDELYGELNEVESEINRLIDERTLVEDTMDSIALLDTIEDALVRDDVVSSV